LYPKYPYSGYIEKLLNRFPKSPSKKYAHRLFKHPIKNESIETIRENSQLFFWESRTVFKKGQK